MLELDFVVDAHHDLYTGYNDYLTLEEEFATQQLREQQSTLPLITNLYMSRKRQVFFRRWIEVQDAVIRAWDRLLKLTPHGDQAGKPPEDSMPHGDRPKRASEETGPQGDERAKLSEEFVSNMVEYDKYERRLTESRVLAWQYDSDNETPDPEIVKRAKNWYRRDWEKPDKKAWWKNFDEQTQTELAGYKSKFHQIWKS